MKTVYVCLFGLVYSLRRDKFLIFESDGDRERDLGLEIEDMVKRKPGRTGEIMETEYQH